MKAGDYILNASLVRYNSDTLYVLIESLDPSKDNSEIVTIKGGHFLTELDIQGIIRSKITELSCNRITQQVRMCFERNGNKIIWQIDNMKPGLNGFIDVIN